MLHDFFKVSPSMCYVFFKDVLCVFQGSLNNFYGCFMDVSRMFQACFEEVARILQEGFKGIEIEVSKVFQGNFKVVSGKF